MSEDRLLATPGPKKVVIADDEPSVRLLVQATIEPDGYEVLTASDGDEAIELIRQHTPSLALLDVKMPGRTGLDILREIKSDPDLKQVKVILLTASAHISEMNTGMAAGADFYLTKPFSPRELRVKVDEALFF